MKNQKNKMIAHIAASAAVLLCGAAMPFSVSASSVEDVYAAMRRIGLPESMIQEAKIQYQNTEHDANGMSINGNYFTYDVWADMVEIYEDDIWNAVGAQFGISGEDIKNASTDTTAPPQSTPADTTNTTTVSETTAAPVVTEKPFINMTLDEKKAYIASLPESERASFLANLSTSERNSIIKQMDTDNQATIANGFIELGKELGMNITVDKLDGDGISYSVRNSDGTLIDVSSVGTSVDDTGWDTTVPVLGSSAMILSAIGGLTLFTRKQRKEEQDA